MQRSQPRELFPHRLRLGGGPIVRGQQPVEGLIGRRGGDGRRVVAAASCNGRLLFGRLPAAAVAALATVTTATATAHRHERLAQLIRRIVVIDRSEGALATHHPLKKTIFNLHKLLLGEKRSKVIQFQARDNDFSDYFRLGKPTLSAHDQVGIDIQGKRLQCKNPEKMSCDIILVMGVAMLAGGKHNHSSRERIMWCSHSERDSLVESHCINKMG
jgi:hypothetical protein